CLHRRGGPAPHRRTDDAACAGSLPAPGGWTALPRTTARSGARGYAARSYRPPGAADDPGRASQQALQPAVASGEGLVEGTIRLQRGDGDVTLHHRVKVGARAAVFGIAGNGNPVPLLAPRVDHLHRCSGTGTVAQAGQLDTADMLQRQVGHVDIEHGARRQIELAMRL